MSINAPKCRLCDAPLVRTFVDLGSSPPCQSLVAPEDLEKSEEFFPLHVRLCERCFLVQLPESLAPERIFGEYAYFSSYVDTLVRAARDYCDAVVKRFGLGPASRVVEIASNDGYLLQHFAARGIPCLGIEPAANVAAAAVAKGIPTLVRFFGAETAREVAERDGRADLVVGNNVLAHVPRLHDFVEGLARLVADDGVVTMEFPHLLQLVRQNQFDTIYHEHFSYLSLATAQQAFAAHGLAIFDVEEIPNHGGSLRIWARHAGDASKPIEPRVGALLRREEEAGMRDFAFYAAFAERVHETKRRLLELLIGLRREGKQIVGYGAPGKSVTLLNYCGIRTDLVDYCVDRNPYKQGKHLAGVRIPIHAPERIRETRPDYLLVLPWNILDEVMEHTAYVREWGGRWIVPIPSAKVIA